MTVTKRRKGATPLRYDIRANGKTVGAAHRSESGAGWHAVGNGIPLRNSWAEGLSYESVMAAADAAVAYVKQALKSTEVSRG